MHLGITNLGQDSERIQTPASHLLDGNPCPWREVSGLNAAKAARQASEGSYAYQEKTLKARSDLVVPCAIEGIHISALEMLQP